MHKKGKLSGIIIAVDIFGFILIAIGAWLIRFAKDEPVSIAGTVVMALGAAMLALSRYLGK